MAIYAVADLHGQGKLYDQIIEAIKPDDTLYIIGDLCDRGPDGYRMMEDALSRPNIIYLKGNHEDMFVEAARDWKTNRYSTALQLHTSQGGLSTLTGWEKAGSSLDILDKLDKLPETAIYKNTQGKTIKLIHSGAEGNPLWDREHFKMYCNIPEDTIIVHGHSNTVYVSSFYTKVNSQDPPIYKYNNNQKIDIDLWSYHTHKTAILNLDTLLPFYVY